MKILVLLVGLLGLSGCAYSPPGNGSLPLGSPERAADNAERLTRLWQERTGPGSVSDFTLDAGDVLTISVPGLEEMEEHTTRVSATGTISLPLIGSFQAAGRTEEELADELRQRLEASVMYDPAVTIYVTESRHRTVGVIGAVYNPGFYEATSERQTVLDAISLAGGMTESAAPRALLLPAPAPDASGQRPAPVAPTPEQLRRGGAVSIDFDDLAEDGSSFYLNLPVRPGDVIVVPERGHVLVKGWVHKPGSYEISEGLTVLGAVTAAGGTRFAADPSAVELLRNEPGGASFSRRFDLRDLQRGGVDVPVKSGDVIDVSHSTAKVIASGFFEFLGRVLNIGAAAF